MNISMLRTRWAAIGAAVAVTLGAGGLGISYAATSPAGATTYVPITPCRLVDTRTPGTVGPRSTPIGAAETYNVSAYGDNGQCTGIPTNATSLELNVTSLGATTGTFLTLWAAGGTRPEVSHLNPQPGAPPIPNSVTTGLSAGGQFSIFNAAGSVNVLVDVVGYYADHTHDSASITNEPGVAFNTVKAVNAVSAAEVVATVSIRPPSAGYVTVHATGSWFTNTADRQLTCQITDGTSSIDGTKFFLIDTDPSNSDLAMNFSLEETFSVPQWTGLSLSGQPFNLVCTIGGAGGDVRDIQMTATFFPTSYAPLVLVPIPFPSEAVPPGTPDGMGGFVGA